MYQPFDSVFIRCCATQRDRRSYLWAAMPSHDVHNLLHVLGMAVISHQ